MLAPWKKSYDQHKQHIKKQRRYFADKGLSSQSYGFSISHVWLWELDHKERWALKNWWFWTVVLEKTLEIPWTSRRSNQPILKEMSPEYSSERLMLKLKLQYFGRLTWRTDSLEKTMMLGKTEGRRKKKGTTEDEMVGWHYWVNGHEFEQAQGVSDGQGSLACCSPWGRKELDLTEWLNWTEPLINSLKLENLKLFLLSLYKSLT